MDASPPPGSYQPLASPDPASPPRVSRFRKFRRNFIIILILLLAGLVYWKYFFTYSEGYRTGLLQKFSRKGTLFKTYEGELILSSIRSQEKVALASEKFFFSVPDEKTAKKLESLQGHFITVRYRMKNGILPWRGDSPYLVDSVKTESQP
ncbi:MAG: hypothetical protein ACO25B_02780 [Chitinophagaceae bacterium]